MATKKTNEAKFTAWTANMKVEASGSISGCALELFGYIDSPELRIKVLALMQTRHENLIEAGV